MSVVVKTREEYERAELFLPWNAKKITYNTDVRPTWIGAGPQFWFTDRSREGTRYVLMDPSAGSEGAMSALFDHEALATALSSAGGTQYAPTSLPLGSLTASDDGNVTFSAGGSWWRWDGKSLAATGRPFASGGAHVVSPDGRWALIVEDHDVYLRSAVDGMLRRVTWDGEPYYDYATRPEQGRTTVTSRLLGQVPTPMALWSPDSTKVLFHRIDQRRLPEMHLVQGAPDGVATRPVLHSYRAALAGDEELPLAEFFIFDLVAGALTAVQDEPVEIFSDSPLFGGTGKRKVWWSDDGSKVFYLRSARRYVSLTLHVADATTGSTRVVVVEEMPDGTQVDAGPPMAVVTRSVGVGDEVVWYSERDGWGQLYRLQTADGDLLGRVTNGEYAVNTVEGITDGWVYFTATGREDGRDPYYVHFYRVRLDGSDLTLLTPEDAEHEVWLSPGAQYFVDRYSRVDLAPVTVVRRADGTLVRQIAEADIADLVARGWRWPERFQAMAADGQTSVYGVIFYPAEFDPSQKYPIVEDIYPGPHRLRAPRAFTFDQAHALAALGFITMTIDGVGQAYRSRAIHQRGIGEHFGRAGGLEDHVAAIRELAATRPYLDADRVGIYGHSAGGYASARAMLLFSDFYKVAVSSGGNHDPRHHRAGWPERWSGLRADQANAAHAHRLQGKLMLAYGDIDDTVHPNMTLELTAALIAANKDFDMLVLPNRNHGFYDLDRGDKDLPGDPYFIRRRWDYFVRHLMGAEPTEFALTRP